MQNPRPPAALPGQNLHCSKAIPSDLCTCYRVGGVGLGPSSSALRSGSLHRASVSSPLSGRPQGQLCRVWQVACEPRVGYLGSCPGSGQWLPRYGEEGGAAVSAQQEPSDQFPVGPQCFTRGQPGRGHRGLAPLGASAQHTLPEWTPSHLQPEFHRQVAVSSKAQP